jgi:hypothetical protein
MIREFVVGCSKTINKGNYNSIRVETSLTVVVAEGDDFAALKLRALQDLKQTLEEVYKSQLKEERQDG